MCIFPYEDVLGCHTSILRIRTIKDPVQSTILIYLTPEDKDVNSLDMSKLFPRKVKHSSLALIPTWSP